MDSNNAYDPALWTTIALRLWSHRQHGTDVLSSSPVRNLIFRNEKRLRYGV